VDLFQVHWERANTRTRKWRYHFALTMPINALIELQVD